MSKSTTDGILSSPNSLLTDFTANDIVLLKNGLFKAKEQILAKYGKFDINEKGLPQYTEKEVFNRMQDSTKQLFWSVNNASNLIEFCLKDNDDLSSKIKDMRQEITSYQIEIVRLQKQLEQ